LVIGYYILLVIVLKNKKKPKIFFGWWIVVATGIVSGIGIMMLNQGASVLFKPIASDLGIDRTTTSIANGIGGLVNGVLFACAGWLVVKYGPKWVVFWGTLIAGIGLLCMNFVFSTLSYFIIWGIFASGGITVGLSIPIDAAVTNWFVRKRGLANSLKWGLMSLITMALLPLIGWIIESFNWKVATTVWGIFLIAGAFILLYFVKLKRPEYYGLLPDGAVPDKHARANSEDLISTGNRYAAGVEETEYTFKQAVKSSSFWIVTGSWGIIVIIYSGFILHVVPFLTDRGIDPVAAASMLALMTFFILPTRIFGSLLSDHVNKKKQKYYLSASILLIALGLAVFLFMSNIFGVYLLLILFGLGFGAYIPLSNLLLARFFGRNAFANIIGVSQLITAPFAFISPIYTGWVYDTTRSYLPAFTFFAVLGFAGAVLILFIRVPKQNPGSQRTP
jgi:cyanate permease